LSLEKIKNEIDNCEKRYNRKPGNVKLIAVSKVQPEERIKLLLEKNHKIFGENRVQEAHAKWINFRRVYHNIELHLLGYLQTNKVKLAFEIFNFIHSLDRPKLAQAIANEAQKKGFCPKIFVQINTGKEKQKSGVLPEDANHFISECIKKYELPIVGLMCIPPIHEESEKHFQYLNSLANNNGLKELSMGMSSDFQKAIKYGSTFVRVGTAIFGSRVSLS